jgi:hypothetical protein
MDALPWPPRATPTGFSQADSPDTDISLVSTITSVIHSLLCSPTVAHPWYRYHLNKTEIISSMKSDLDEPRGKKFESNGS